ncbi:MAG: PKD domain-containing protein [Saprospiraceae bacterium]|nr:PKD domain-containing protein [Saprospiraceae bacterium]
MRSLIFLLLPLVPFAQVPCTYLAYDGFDYPAAAPLDDLNGGSGWAEPWLTQNDDQTLPGYQTSSGTGSLAFGNLQTIGRFATGGRVYLTAGRRLNTSDAGPFGEYVSEFNEGIGTSANGGELWMSALLRKDQNTGQRVFAGLHGSGLPWCDNCTGEKVQFGYFGADSDVAGERRWTLRLGDQYFPTQVPVSIGTTAFFVVKFTFNPNGTGIDLFINPAELGSGSPTPVLSQSSAVPLVLRSAVTYLGSDPGNGAVDEIRLGTSYACAAPDASVTIDLPPVAIITASSNDGEAPFTVILSGSTSYDPESGPLTYQWNFGDGSPSATGASQTHTYTALGQLTARLTVTDQSGQQHTAVYPITVRNQGGSYPCLSSFTLVKQADCDGTGGIIRINDHPENFTLKNVQGLDLPLTNGNEFHNLNLGLYIYSATSNAGCSDDFKFIVPIDSNTCPGWQPQQCDLAIGTNLSGFADWVPERPLRNLMKHVRSEPIAFNDDCFCWDNGNLALIEFDADGYPTQVPQMANGVPNKLRYVISSEGANLPPGETCVLLYDGTGELSVGGGVTVTSNAPGRIEFSVDIVGNIFFMVNASQLGDHVRNIRLLRLADEFADLDAEPFYEGFLDKIKPFKALRFMDWGRTNGNPAVHWEDRSSLTHFTYAVPTGVPYEMMVKLANQLKKDVWLCVPHAADSNYVAQMAALFRDQLDPGLTIYLEYSNEVWNWIFAQAHYNADNAPSNLNYGRAMAIRAGQTFRIWHEVFGAEKSRVKRVLGLQAGYNYINEQILSQLDPDDWDLASPASYLGLDHSDTGNPVLNASSTPADIIENARNAWAGFRPYVFQDYNNIKLLGKGIINYEGGQHFVGNVFGIPYPYQQAMWDAQYSPEIHALYGDMLDTIRSWGSRLFGNFSLAGPQESIYGSWGVLNDIDIQPPYLETAPKYQALLDNICEEEPIDAVAEEAGLAAPQWLLYPNPTSGLVWAKLPEGVDLDGPVVVWDVLGREVLRGQGFPVDLGGVAAGVYRLTLLVDGVKWRGTVVVE